MMRLSPLVGVLLFSVISIRARVFNVLDIASLTQQGVSLNSPTATSLSVIPIIALQHFNERYDGILPLSEMIGSCDAILNFISGTIFDDGGVPGGAMIALVGDSRFQQTDFILGPDSSAVSSNIQFFDCLVTNVVECVLLKRLLNR